MIAGVSRHDAWFRAVALALLLLAASPCTAPFSTFDLLPPGTTATVDAAKSKTSTDDLLPVPRVALLPHTLHAPASLLPLSTPAASAWAALHRVLRL